MMTQEKAIRRVQKFLQLARSGNEHEAALAAAEAAKLMDEYQLSEAMLRVQDQTKAPERIIQGHRIIEGSRKERLAAWKRLVASAVASLYGCKLWWTGADLKLFGRESSVQAAAYTTRYLWSEISRLAKKADPDHYVHSTRSWRHSFMVGAAQVVAERLVNERKVKEQQTRAVVATVEPGSTEQALVLVNRDREEVNQEYRSFSKGFVSSTVTARASSSSGYYAGYRAGKSIAINESRGAIGAGAPSLKE